MFFHGASNDMDSSMDPENFEDDRLHFCPNCSQQFNSPAPPEEFQHFDDWQTFEKWMFEPLTTTMNGVEQLLFQEPASDEWSGPVAGDISKGIQGNSTLEPDNSKSSTSTVNNGSNTQKEHNPDNPGNLVSRNTGPYRCEVNQCDRSFRYPKDLRRHVLTHTHERRHMCPQPQCEYATKGFSRRDALARHVKSVHKGKKE